MKAPIPAKTLKNIVDHYGIKKLSYFSNYDSWGMCYYTEGLIEINYFLKNKKKKFLNTLFHEIGHLYCYRNDIWKNYHIDKVRLSKKEKELIVKTGLKAERWIENWAEKEMKKWFPKVSYDKGYYKPYKTKLFKEYLEENFK